MANTDTILHQADVEAVIDAEIAELVVRTGNAKMVTGTIAVADTKIKADSIIRLYNKTIGGTPGALYISAKAAGTSFTISSTSATDTSVVRYEILSY